MSRRFLTLIVFVATISVAACQDNANKETKAELTPTEFEAKIVETEEAIVLDVCTPNEYGQQHLKNAVNVNYHSDGFDTHLEQMDKEKPYFVYCWAGSRSAKAANKMREMGFKNVYELKGGISNWMKQGKPVKGAKGKSTHNLHKLIEKNSNRVL